MATIRVFYTGQQGTMQKNFNWPPVSQKSAVSITAVEFQPPAGPEFDALARQRPWVGSAPIWVSNVGPHGVPGGEAGGVEFMLHVDWQHPIDVMVTITVLEDIEQYFQA